MRNLYGKITAVGSNIRFLLAGDPAKTSVHTPRTFTDPEIERDRAFIARFLEEIANHRRPASMGLAKIVDEVADEITRAFHRSKKRLASLLPKNFRRIKSHDEAASHSDKKASS